jgi:drug/metabolite transporter (DMT)-like permease
VTVRTALQAPHHEPEARRLGVGAVLAATVFWSFGSVLAKGTDAEGVVVSFWRLWVATVILSVVCAVMRAWPTRAQLVRCIPAGVLFAANIAVFFSALERISVANALVIAAMAPVLMLPIAVVVLGERLTGIKVLCAAVAVAGVVVSVLTAPDVGGAGNDALLGNLLAVGGLLLWLGYLVAAKRARQSVDTVPFMFSVSVIGAVSISVYVAVAGTNLNQIEGEGWVWIVLLALGPGIAGHGLVAWAQQRVDASVSTVLMQAEPVGASIAAYVFLDETMSWPQVVSMGVVIGALCVLAYRETREAPDPAQAGDLLAAPSTER